MRENSGVEALYIHLATSEIVMLVWMKGDINKKLSLCYTIVYYYNGAHRYEQFLQDGWLYWALILLGLALSFKRLCVFSLHGVI